MIWDPEFVEQHAGTIAHHLAKRSKLSKRELFEAILEPFDIGFEEPRPSGAAETAPDRTTNRGCDAIWTNAESERAETLDELRG